MSEEVSTLGPSRPSLSPLNSRLPVTCLVAYSTKGGATREIAEAIGDELRSTGVTVDVLPVKEVVELARYDAVVLGSAIYYGRWRAEALRFARTHAPELKRKAVWLFDSGPLSPEADAGAPESVPTGDELLHAIGARSRITFGGRLLEEDAGFLTRRIMGTGKAGTYGDFRNLHRVRTWAKRIGEEMESSRATATSSTG